MGQNFLKHLYNCFAGLIDRYGFSKENELNDGQSYSVEYSSNIFVIKFEKYRREFYATLYKTGHSDDEINLFNLLRYLNRDFTEFEYFYGELHGENELEEYYRKQFNHISNTIYENFVVINDFFSSGNYESKFTDIRKFMLKKYPELFRQKE
jgi:hypothetical protein